MNTTRVTISVGDKTYKTKPDRLNNITFTTKELTVDELKVLIANGSIFAFNHGKQFDVKGKKNDNFISASLLVYDIDHSENDMLAYIDGLSFKPLIAYETFSSTDENNRFRLVYKLSHDINNINAYKATWEGFAQQNNISSDRSMINPSQMWLGTNQFACIYLNRKSQPVSPVTNLQCDRVINFNQAKYQYNPNSRVIRALFNSPCLGEFIREVGLVVTETKEYDFKGHEYVSTRGKHVEIKRSFNGRKRRIKKDKDNRHGQLCSIGLKKLAINPNMDFDEMVYNLAFEVCCQFDNSDGRFTPDVLIGIAKWVFAHFDKNKIQYSSKKYKLNTQLLDTQSKRAKVLGMLRRQETLKKIEEHIDLKQSVSQNAILCGVSRDSIRKYLNEKDIKLQPDENKSNPHPNISDKTFNIFKKYYQPNLNSTQVLDIIEEKTGHRYSRDTFKLFKKYFINGK